MDRIEELINAAKISELKDLITRKNKAEEEECCCKKFCWILAIVGAIVAIVGAVFIVKRVTESKYIEDFDDDFDDFEFDDCDDLFEDD